MYTIIYIKHIYIYISISISLSLSIYIYICISLSLYIYIYRYTYTPLRRGEAAGRGLLGLLVSVSTLISNSIISSVGISISIMINMGL